MEKMKQEKYELLCKQVESLAAGETNVVGVLANVSAAMKTMFPEEYFWVGFYTAYPRPLPKGKGVLDIEDTIGNLVGHCFVAPMGTVEIHRIAKNHHFGW
jgi:putative methionine-R-sulfoxide reductase with GAF domain